MKEHICGLKSHCVLAANHRVAHVFQDSLHALMATLSASNPFFVRCIKPNMDKVGHANFCCAKKKTDRKKKSQNPARSSCQGQSLQSETSLVLFIAPCCSELIIHYWEVMQTLRFESVLLGAKSL